MSHDSDINIAKMNASMQTPVEKATPKAMAESLFGDKHKVLGLLYANLQDNFLLVDQNLRIQLFNQTTYRQVKNLLGLEISIGTSVLDLAPLENHTRLIHLYKAVLQGEIMESESVIKTENAITYIHNTFTPARNEYGVIIGVFVYSKDITPQKKKEIELKEKEERWRFALEGSNIGLWDWNLQTGEMYFSDSYKRLYGFEDDELENKTEEWTSRIHPEDKFFVLGAVEKHTASSNPNYETTYRLKDKAGNYRWILSKGKLFSWDENGIPLRMIGTHTDITQQKEAEEALKESHERFQLAAKATSEALWEWDIANDKVYTSPVYKDLFGFDIDPTKKYDEWHELIHPDDREETIKGYYDAIADPSKERWAKDYRYLRADGSYAHVSDHCLILRNQEGKAIKAVGALQDITQQKIAEEKAIKSNERFKYATKATSDAIYDWDIETNELYWGEGLYKLFGHQARDLTIKVWETLLHPEEKEKVVVSLNSTLENWKKKYWKQEYRLKKADGNYSYVLERGYILRDPEGKAIRMIGAVQDITNQKEKEQQLIESNERYQLATKATSDAIWDWDLKTNSLVWSEGLTKLFGYQTTEVGINDWEKLVHIDDREEVYNSIQYAIAHNKKRYWKAEYRFLHKDGTERFVYDRGFIVRNEAGEAIRMIGAMQDNTDRKEKEQELLKSNERFDIVMRATNDLIWDWDLEKGTFYRDKEGVRKVYGIEDETTIASIYQWLQRVHPDDHAQLETAINEIRSATNQAMFEAEYRFKKDDGEYAYIYDRGLLIRDKEGRPIRLIGAAQNITERKQLEQQLLEKELNKQKIISQSTIETQERERGEIGKELHDNVNQVLTTTKLYLDLSMSNVELKDELIRKSSQNIIYVINEIRQLSRSLMNPSLGDLGLLDSISDLVENINLTKKLQVELAVEETIETAVSDTQKLMIYRIIQEALNNALRHSKASQACITLSENDGQASLQISDNGIGFEPANIKKGAGLNNIQNRVYLANGTIVIRSQPQKGCTLSITFPTKPIAN